MARRPRVTKAQREQETRVRENTAAAEVIGTRRVSRSMIEGTIRSQDAAALWYAEHDKPVSAERCTRNADDARARLAAFDTNREEAAA
jgi:hypothetical protein